MEYLKELASQMADEVCGYSEYMKLASMAENEDERQKLQMIAEQEHNHYNTIKDIIESYM